MSANYAIDRDLKEAEAMVQALDDYIRGDQLYGNVGGGLFSSGNMPKLTVGALLMRLRRLHELRAQLDSRQAAKLREASEEHARVRREWRVHYEEKLLREANSRLDAMRTFFRECADSPRQCPGIYKPEALRRTIVQEIIRTMQEMNIESDDLDKKKRDIDGNLRGVVAVAPFLWSEDLRSVYPKDEFWWLYHAPPQPDDE